MSSQGADAASYAALGGYSGERVERFVWCVPTPLVGREAASWCRDTELSAC